jgi:radical SAM superfamily enzyme YgiQ (UPF0313 family)
MRDAGCIELKFGIESGSEQILQAMGKNITCNQIRRTVALASSVGIRVKAFLVHGFPGETLETTRETISLLKEVGHMIDRVSLFRFVPLPGSYVFRNAKAYGLTIPERIEDWEKFHIYHNDYHWWGNVDDFREVENSYKELAEFVEEKWR